ncbi:glycoside hydrolase family 15 protein [Planctomicrobium sp. SH661]|uniref:glycoside hydrolase family 15 protein n=1 Tax=Planctomicrobium sp. SH661 TaxID=3448124 RepID=UPI003F5CA0FC
MSLRIEDYALIGDCQTAALVGNDGSIDWLCLPRFDSAACFAGLLGTPEHGRWQIAPVEEVIRVKRRYRPKTLILETELETASGIVRLIDFMPPRTKDPDLMRIVEGVSGRVLMRLELVIRFDYGSIIPWVRHLPRGIRAVAGPDTLVCFSDVPLHGENLKTVAEFVAAEGQRTRFSLVWSTTFSPDPQETDVEKELQETEAWWTGWSDLCRYHGEWREAVQRSLITLKALTYAPTGGVVAAVTTSLPEHLGGVRNWDYRYCWLRDATFTLYALMGGGYIEEAKAWREWLINAVAGTPHQIQIMYGIGGERRLTEQQLDWLPGYENSRPVRIGNAAYSQHQLDVYGEVVDALHVGRRAGLSLDENAWRVERELVRFLELDWRKPDEGIWEIRGPRQHFTHSKVMAWVALDRAVDAVETFGLPGDARKWSKLREEIFHEVCERGFNRRLNSFVQHYDSNEPDASLLMLSLVGFLPATDPRMIGTVEYIQQRLVRDGFVDRYRSESDVDGLPPGEGAFLLCTFWLADNLALQGRIPEARELFQRLLSLRNDVGLLSEEYDVHSQRLVGNFPQAFSHIGLINTALNLSEKVGPAEDRVHATSSETVPEDLLGFGPSSEPQR